MKKIILITSILLTANILLAQIINIPSDFPTIQQGINAAVNGDTVLVAPGTYVDTINFNGKNITVASYFLTTQDTSYISQTIIEGDSLGTVVTFTSGEDSTSLLAGFTICNGFIYNWDSVGGGGISIRNANPVLSDLYIIDNFARQGGGIYCENSTVVINNCIVAGNEVIDLTPPIFGTIGCQGGGLYCSGSVIVIENTEIANNNAIGNGDLVLGGGIYCISSEIVMNNSLVQNNHAMDGIAKGGGIYCESSIISVTNNQVKENSSGYGGGFYALSTFCDIESSMFEDNLVSYKGGGLTFTNSDSFMSQTTIRNNYSTDVGGGIYCENNSTLSFDSTNRCDIYENFALFGADLFTDSQQHIVVDTFSVFVPTDIFCVPLSSFTFDIQHGMIEQVSADLYVSPAGDNANSGLNPSEPLRTIHYAKRRLLPASGGSNTIYLDDGTYSPSINGEVFPVIMPDLVNLSGGGPANVTLDAESQSRVMVIDQNTQNTISGMTIRGGLTESYSGYGGGIYCKNSNAHFYDLSLKNNTSYSSGGGIYISNGQASLSNVEILENTAEHNNGGGMCIMGGGQIELTDCIIGENSAAHNNGGGISCYEGSLYFTNVSIENNHANRDGGGLYLAGDTEVYGENTTVSGNTADDGGGIGIWGSSNISNLLIKENTAGYGGGIYCEGSLSLESMIISGNNSSRGGGVFSFLSPMDIYNTVLSGNTASNRGGAILFINVIGFPKNLNLVNVTITENSAPTGGGIYGQNDPNIELVNCISWLNSPDEINGPAEVSYSNIYGSWPGVGNIEADPGFEGSGVHPFQLIADSPCIDAGTPDPTGLNLPPDDLIGNVRIWDGDGNGVAIVDMGAYEYNSVPVGMKVPGVQNSIITVQNYPNPVCENLIIEFDLAKTTLVSIQIYNNMGELMMEPKNHVYSSGPNQVILNLIDLEDGLYFCRMQIGYKVITNKIIKI